MKTCHQGAEGPCSGNQFLVRSKSEPEEKVEVNKVHPSPVGDNLWDIHIYMRMRGGEWQQQTTTRAHSRELSQNAHNRERTRERERERERARARERRRASTRHAQKDQGKKSHAHAHACTDHTRRANDEEGTGHNDLRLDVAVVVHERFLLETVADARLHVRPHFLTQTLISFLATHSVLRCLHCKNAPEDQNHLKKKRSANVCVCVCMCICMHGVRARVCVHACVQADV